MKTTKETIEKQLEFVHERDRMVCENRAHIKNWCITVWMAAFAIVSTQKTSFGIVSASLFLIAPVLIFWTMEGMYGAVTVLTVQQMVELERRLAESNFTFKHPSDLFVLSRYTGFSWKYKLRAFILASFSLETIVIFYMLLLVASALAILSLFGRIAI